MAKCIFKRLIAGTLSLFILITTTFFLMHVIPGGPFSPSRQRNVLERILEQVSERYDLNDLLPAQYARYLNNLLHGDVGASFKRQDITVSELITNDFPVSTKMGVLGVAVALAAGIPLGTVTAAKRGKLADGAPMVLATIDISVPSFVFCVLMMYVFCEEWKIFPSYGLISRKYYVLPVFCMTFSQVAYIARLMRSSMLETMCQDYIQTERSKGVPEWEVIGKYALKNSALPMVTYVDPLATALLVGTLIIKRLLSIPGLGHYFISTITDRDYSVTLGLTTFLGVMTIGCNLITDIICAVIDPRVKITE